MKDGKKLCCSDDQPRSPKRQRSSKADGYEEVIRAWPENRPSMKATLIYERLWLLGYL